MKPTDAGSTNLATDLAERLRQRIQLQDLAEGVFFATEADLAQEYDVSRKIAREAVMRLKAQGFLESRRRKGLIIRRPDPVAFFSLSLPSMVQNEADWTELRRLRYVIEVGAIELAVENASTEQMDRLEQLARDYADVVQAGGTNAEQDQIELAFHGLILEMTGSVLVARLRHVLAEFFRRAQQEHADGKPTEQTIWEHHAIAAAVRDRDPDRARSLIRLHFRNMARSEA